MSRGGGGSRRANDNALEQQSWLHPHNSSLHDDTHPYTFDVVEERVQRQPALAWSPRSPKDKGVWVFQRLDGAKGGPGDWYACRCVCVFEGGGGGGARVTPTICAEEHLQHAPWLGTAQIPSQNVLVPQLPRHQTHNSGQATKERAWRRGKGLRVGGGGGGGGACSGRGGVRCGLGGGGGLRGEACSPFGPEGTGPGTQPVAEHTEDVTGGGGGGGGGRVNMGTPKPPGGGIRCG